MKITQSYNNYTVTFNANAKTMAASGSTTTTFTGGNINELWPDFKESMGYMNEIDGVTITFNDINHSYTVLCNNFSQTMTDDDLSTSGFKINKVGKKLKALASGLEIIYTKQ